LNFPPMVSVEMIDRAASIALDRYSRDTQA
jgi:hypothetical protein